MASYGPYETVREIAASLDCVVSTARKAGESEGEDLVVKALSKSSFDSGASIFGGGGDSDGGEAVRSFEDRVAVQKQAAAGTSRVAPIIDSGSDESSSWAVYKNYPRSLQKLIQGRVVLNEAGLFHVVKELVDGLVAMKACVGRSHGNIKASNVLVSAAPKLTDTDLFLTDPVAGDASRAEEIEKADLKALGAVIVQLVQRREITGSTDWLIVPLEKSKEWTEVAGKQVDGWLALCNRLLDPNVNLSEFSLTEVAAAVAQLEPKAGMSVLATALITVLVLGAAAVAFFMMQPNPNSNLLVFSDPGGLRILLNGESVGVTPEGPDAALPLELSEGSYQLRGEFNDLDPYVATVTVTPEGEIAVTPEGGLSSPIELQADGRRLLPLYLSYGSLIVTSQPPRAEIVFNNGEKGQTPYTNLYARPGPVRFEVSLENHAPWQAPEEAVLVKGESLLLGTNLLERAPGQVLVQFGSAPFPAVVTQVGSEKTFEVPGAGYFDPGRYEFVAKSRNYAPRTNTLEILPEDPKKTVSFEFSNTKVRLVTTPAGASVFVGDENVSSNAEGGRKVTPMVIYWPPGEDVVFRFEAPGYEITNSTPKTLVEREPAVVRQALAAAMGVLYVSTDPLGAEVLLETNGVSTVIGSVVDPSKPLLVQALPGKAFISARYDGLISPARITNQFAYGKIDRKVIGFDYGTLQLSVMPADTLGVGVTVDGRSWDRRLSGELYLSNGLHRVEVSSASLGEVSSSVEVLNRSLTNHMVTLGAYLSITSNPAGAAVYLVGSEFRQESFDVGALGEKLLGKTPFEKRVKPGAMRFYMHLTSETNYTMPTLTFGAGVKTNLLGWNFERPDRLTNSVGLDLVYIEAAQLFAATTEVSQGQYEKVMGGNPSVAKGPQLPVTSVAWADAIVFCERLTALERENGTLLAGYEYRLPKTAQWMIIAGSKTNWNHSVTLFNKHSSAEGVAAGVRNQFGLYHTRGNVWEWCLDRKGVVRGGSYRATRPAEQPAFGRAVELNVDVGFRVMLVPTH